MIGPAEIASMRAAIDQAALPDSGLIERATLFPDGMGGETLIWATVSAAVPCRVALPAGTPGMSLLGKELAERIGNRMFYVITFPAETDARDGDRLTVSGVVYDILVGKINASWELARRAVGLRQE